MCVFCKIINKEIPCYKVYETETVLAFLDISQATVGHTLVIPKKHYDNVFMLDFKAASDIFKVVAKVSTILKQSLNINDLNIINNNGTKAGQMVNHFHIHLVPRYDSDGIKITFSSHEPNYEKLEETHKLLKKDI